MTSTPTAVSALVARLRPLLARVRPGLSALVARLRAHPIPSLVAAVALIAAVGLAVAASANSPAPATAAEYETVEVRNTAGGYQLTVPQDWSSSQVGSATTIRDPQGDAVVRIGVGAAGPLPDAAALFFQQVGRNYRDVSYLGVQADEIGGAPALTHAASGLNKSDARIRFLAISIEHQPRNLAVAVFTTDGSDPNRVLPRVTTIVDTLRSTS